MGKWDQKMDEEWGNVTNEMGNKGEKRLHSKLEMFILWARKWGNGREY